MVTGLDLVRLQLLVADGQPLPIAQDDVTLRGHAVEARLYAEDPAQGYLPQTGSLIRFGPPAAPGVRNDVGVYEGAQVSPYYDPMLAKLIVYGQDRDAAVDRLRLALNDYVVMGVKTNLDLLKAIAQDDRFRAGHTTTQFIAENLEPGLAATPEIPADAVMAAAACQLEMQGILDRESATLSEGGYDPWRGGGRWRLGKWGIEFSYQSQGQTFQATATRRAGTGLWEISAGDELFLVEITRARDGKIAIRQGDAVDYAEARSHQGVIHLFWKSRDYLLEERRARAAGSQGYGDSQEAAQGSGTITAPIPGKVVEVRVRRGDRVSAHQTLVVLEAMKMEHLVAAPYGAVVGRIHPRLGDEVARGAPLIELEAP
jgi:3-methylcrotonyl-CoA carboxylase alpha subunit